MFELVEHSAQNAKIKVVGMGGGGGNAINTMIEFGLDGVDFIAANTDMQALRANLAPHKVQLGCELTKGLGAGANPDVGRNAALEDQRTLAEVLSGADMVFVTAGMGGGTGTGGAPVIAKLAKELGALTVGVVTKPFAFEGRQRSLQADHGLNELRESVDTLITIPNEKLLSLVAHDVTVVDAFKQADAVLYQAVKGISDLITVHGLINLDFADVRTVMNEMGMALMGTGTSSGENRAIDAATRAIASPLLEDTSIKGATGILINITGGSDMTLHEISESSKIIQEEAHEDANILFGAVIDESMTNEVRVTVIATGFNKPLTRTVRSHMNKSQQQGMHGAQVPSIINEKRAPAVPSREYPVAATRQAPHEAHRVDEFTQASRAQEAKQEYHDIAKEVGVLEYREDEYDIPTFLRKQAD
jgi:cell division protein FtsZ